MGDSDYLAAFHHVVMPIAAEVTARTQRDEGERTAPADSCSLCSLTPGWFWCRPGSTQLEGIPWVDIM